MRYMYIIVVMSWFMKTPEYQFPPYACPCICGVL